MDQTDNNMSDNDSQHPSKTNINATNINIKYIHNQHQSNKNHETTKTAHKAPYDPRQSMIQNGFKPLYQIAKTLQGSIWKVIYLQFECEAVIKITDKQMANKKIGYDHKYKRYVYGCGENIIDEIKLMHYLNDPQAPKAKGI